MKRLMSMKTINMMKAMERKQNLHRQQIAIRWECHSLQGFPKALREKLIGHFNWLNIHNRHFHFMIHTYIMVYVWSARVEYWKAKSTWSVCSLLSRVPRWSTPPMVPTYFKVIKIKHQDSYHITLGFTLFVCWSRWRWKDDPHCISRTIRGDCTTVGFPVQLEMTFVKDKNLVGEPNTTCNGFWWPMT